MNSLQNTVVIITGAGSGIGRQLTLQAAAGGAHVIATDISETGLAETGQLASGNVTLTPLDVSDAKAIGAFTTDLMSRLNASAELSRKLILVNNAGVALGSGPFSETDLDDFEWLLNINLWGVVRMTKAVLPHMLAQKQGHIVNLSSVFGLAGVMHQSAYCTAKFGVRGFSDALRMELLGTNIGVTCVHPGGIKTSIATNARRGKGAFVTEAMHQQGAISFEKVAKTTAEAAARQIWQGVGQHKARVLIGADAYQIEWLTRLFPTAYVKLMRERIEKAFRAEG